MSEGRYPNRWENGAIYLVQADVSRIEADIAAIRKTLDAIRTTDLPAIRTDVAVLNAKAMALGTVGGLIAAALFRWATALLPGPTHADMLMKDWKAGVTVQQPAATGAVVKGE